MLLHCGWNKHLHFMACVFAFLLGSWVFVFFFNPLDFIHLVLFIYFLLGLIHHIELTVFWSYTPSSSECMTCVTSTLLMICNDNSSKGSCTKWLMHFIILQYLLVSNSHCGLWLDGWLHVSCCIFVRVDDLSHYGWRLSFQLSAQDMAAWLRKRLF